MIDQPKAAGADLWQRLLAMSVRTAKRQQHSISYLPCENNLMHWVCMSVRDAKCQWHAISYLPCGAKLMHGGCRVGRPRLTACAPLAGAWHQPYCLASAAVWSVQFLRHSGLCCWPRRAGSWSPWSLFQPPPPPLLLRCQSQYPSPC